MEQVDHPWKPTLEDDQAPLYNWAWAMPGQWIRNGLYRVQDFEKILESMGDVDWTGNILPVRRGQATVFERDERGNKIPIVEGPTWLNWMTEGFLPPVMVLPHRNRPGYGSHPAYAISKELVWEPLCGDPLQPGGLGSHPGEDYLGPVFSGRKSRQKVGTVQELCLREGKHCFFESGTDSYKVVFVPRLWLEEEIPKLFEAQPGLEEKYEQLRQKYQQDYGKYRLVSQPRT